MSIFPPSSSSTALCSSSPSTHAGRTGELSPTTAAQSLRRRPTPVPALERSATARPLALAPLARLAAEQCEAARRRRRTSAAAEVPAVLGRAAPRPTAPEEAGAPGGPAQGGARHSYGGTGGSEWRHGGVPASTPANAWM